MSGYTRMLIQCTPQLVKTQMGEWQIAASHEIPQSTREQKNRIQTLSVKILAPNSDLRKHYIAQINKWTKCVEVAK